MSERDPHTPPIEVPKTRRKRHGLVIVNTGEGKGKTTAALGVIFRAWGRDFKIRMFQFIKHTGATFGEHRAAMRLDIPIEALGDGFTWLSKDMDRTQALAVEQWGHCKEAILQGEEDIIVLDEFTYAMHYGWIPCRRRRGHPQAAPGAHARHHHGSLRAAGADRLRRPGDRNADDQASLPRAGHSRPTGDRVLDVTLDGVVGRIRPGDSRAMQAALKRQQRLTKPPGSLGRLEDLSVKLAGIFGTDRPTVQGTTLIVAAADHGVVAQGVTGYPQAVTAQMVTNFLAGGAAISVMARSRGADLVIVDAGVGAPLPEHPDLRVVAPGRGTGDITQGPAMTRDQAEACIRAGIDLAEAAAEQGAAIIGTGDMGIGNTTSASAVTAAVTGASPRANDGSRHGTHGPRAGAQDRLRRARPGRESTGPCRGLDVLTTVGGFEIGVLAGVALGGALSRRAVVLDGFVSGAAGLIAHCLCPTIRDYLIGRPPFGRAGPPRRPWIT